MRKKLILFGVLFVTIMLLGVGCKKKDEITYRTFKEITNIAEFQTVPYMETAGKIYEPGDFGNKNYLMFVDGTTLEEYQNYLKKLEEVGFKKHSDNGKEGMEGYVYTASFTKDNLTLTVARAKFTRMTYISASFDLALSEHLIYKDEYVKDLDPNAKNKLHMVQMTANQGCGFIYQLKNGHFVVYDGGLSQEAGNFMKFITDLTPEGEKTIIEGWFISHCHNDHYGTMLSIIQNPLWNDQIRVNGFYYVEPSQTLFSKLTSQTDPTGNMIVSRAYRNFKTEDGGTPEFYRPFIGQKYYFCDIEIDITYTFEQKPLGHYRDVDFNDTSTWLMAYVDGQKILFPGDSAEDGTDQVIRLYDNNYFDLDIYMPSHHGINVYDRFTNLCTYDVLLYGSFRAGSIWDNRADLAAVPQNNRLKAKAKEVFHHGDGSVSLTLPYEIGTAVIGDDWQDYYKPL